MNKNKKISNDLKLVEKLIKKDISKEAFERWTLKAKEKWEKN